MPTDSFPDKLQLFNDEGAAWQELDVIGRFSELCISSFAFPRLQDIAGEVFECEVLGYGTKRSSWGLTVYHVGD